MLKLVTLIIIIVQQHKKTRTELCQQKPKCYTLIQCNAPTNDSDDEGKDTYQILQAEVAETSRQDVIIIAGNLNAKVGSENTSNDRAMGTHGCGTMNDIGERLVEFCSMNNLVTGGTLFKHREIHKLTWSSPNGRVKSQIDHLMIDGKWRRSLLDVKLRSVGQKNLGRGAPMWINQRTKT